MGEREAGGGVATDNRYSPPQDTQQEGRPSMEVSSRRRRLRVVWNDDLHSELSQHTPCYKCGPDEWELCQSVHQCQLLVASIDGPLLVPFVEGVL